MTTLAQQLKQNRAAPIGPTGIQGKQEKLKQIMQASSGKLSAGGGPKASAIGEQIAASTADQAVGQIQAQGDITQQQQDIQSTSQQEQARASQAQFDLKSDAIKQQQAENTVKIADDLAKHKNTMSAQEFDHKLNQGLFAAKLANDQYISTLNQEGQKARLDDELEFKEQLFKSAWEDDMRFFQQGLGLDLDLLADSQAFETMMTQNGLDFQQSLSKDAIKQQQTRDIIKGAGQAVSAYASSPKDDSPNE